MLLSALTRGVGGWRTALAALVLLFLETCAVEGGVYILALFAERSSERAAAEPPMPTEPVLLYAYFGSVAIECLVAYLRSFLIYDAAQRSYARVQSR